VWKHAGASHVAVTLATDDGRVLLRVVDDGAGFDVRDYRSRRPETSFGMLGMSERADLIGGRIDVRSRAGEGTTLELRVPLASAAEAENA
jgi:signal transduction histidine kinase